MSSRFLIFRLNKNCRIFKNVCIRLYFCRNHENNLNKCFDNEIFDYAPDYSDNPFSTKYQLIAAL